MVIGPFRAFLYHYPLDAWWVPKLQSKEKKLRPSGNKALVTLVAMAAPVDLSKAISYHPMAW